MMKHAQWLMVLVIAVSQPISADDENTELVAPWIQVVRDTPYVFSDGFHSNLSTIREWVLLGGSYCAEPDRHILYDHRGRFLTWFENLETVEANQEKLNDVRQTLYEQNRVHRWIEGASDETGYPFALRCDHPHADIEEALARLTGARPEDRVWGTWDGMTAGSPDNPIPLIDVVLQVFEEKSQRQGYEFSNAVKRAFLGQIMIESGARKRSFSAANAVGMLQLRPEVLSDCEIAEEFHLHRMAQVDCAVRLYQQNDRNLRPVFDKRFGTLPDDKRESLYSLLLVQAYHGGIGRMQALLGDGEVGRASRRLAEDADRYSAEDLALGLVFHNMGRIELGLSSLYYLVDVSIASDTVCAARPEVCP